MSKFAEQIAQWVQEERKVIVTDVTYPNGADPAPVDLLREQAALDKLAAFGGWNTAGNTLGVALAQGITVWQDTGPVSHIAQSRFLAHRFLEDWGYQFAVRPQLEHWIETRTDEWTITSHNLENALTFIEAELTTKLSKSRFSHLTPPQTPPRRQVQGRTGSQKVEVAA